MSVDTKLVRITRDQASLLVCLMAGGVQFTGGNWNEETGNIEVPLTDDFQSLYAATLRDVSWMGDSTIPLGVKRIRLLDEYAQLVAPLIAWIDPQPAPTTIEGEANVGDGTHGSGT